MVDRLLSFVIGLFTGLFGALVGLGGGVIMIPLLVRFFKFSQHQAHGTSLMALVFTGLSGTATYYLEGSVDLLAAALLAGAAVFTARLGALYANALAEWKLQKTFGIFLICVSILLVSKSYLFQLEGFSYSPHGWQIIAILLGSGAAAGFISGMMGVGGGSIMVPALVFLAGHSQYTAQGTSLLAMVPGASVGAYTHWRLGNVVTRVLPGLIPGILIGAYAGGSLAHFLTEANLRLIFAVVIIWQGIRDIRGARRLKASLTTDQLRA